MTIFDWLKSRGYDYTWNFKLGGRKPDIVAFSSNEIVALEFKKDGLKSAVINCRKYLKEANRAYILSKSIESSKVVKRDGIGLIESNEHTKLIVEAKHFPMDKKDFAKLIKSMKKKSMLGSDGNNFKKRIVEALRQNPDGLTIVDIAKLLDMHRHTSAKYVDELMKEDTIIQRKVGPAKLCYLDDTVRKRGEK